MQNTEKGCQEHLHVIRRDAERFMLRGRVAHPAAFAQFLCVLLHNSNAVDAGCLLGRAASRLLDRAAGRLLGRASCLLGRAASRLLGRASCLLGRAAGRLLGLGSIAVALYEQQIAKLRLQPARH